MKDPLRIPNLLMLSQQRATRPSLMKSKNSSCFKTQSDTVNKRESASKKGTKDLKVIRMVNETKSLGMREKLNTDLINQSHLVHLAEVAADQAGCKDSFDPPRGLRAPRGRDRKEVSRPFIMGGSLCWKMKIEHIRGTVMPQEKKHKPSTPTLVDMAPSTPIKPSVSQSSSPADKKPSNPSLSYRSGLIKTWVFGFHLKLQITSWVNVHFLRYQCATFGQMMASFL